MEIKDISKQIIVNDDFDLSKASWVISNKDGYVRGKLRGVPRKERSVYLHRLVIGAKKCQIVDHINGNKLDNRLENLRFCTQSQNLMNRDTSSKNTSGYRGVSWDKKNNKWYATITINSKQLNLGRFVDKEVAKKVYDEAARNAFGEFVRKQEYAY